MGCGSSLGSVLSLRARITEPRIGELRRRLRHRSRRTTGGSSPPTRCRGGMVKNCVGAGSHSAAAVPCACAVHHPPMFKVAPSTRLKLTAPVISGRIAFVKVQTWRRSSKSLTSDDVSAGLRDRNERSCSRHARRGASPCRPD